MSHAFLFLGEPRGLVAIQVATLIWLFFGWRMYRTKRKFEKQRKRMGLRASFRPFFLPEKTIASTGFEMYNQLAKERNRSSMQYLIVYVAFAITLVMTFHHTYPNAGSHVQRDKPSVAQNDTTKAA